MSETKKHENTRKEYFQSNPPLSVKEAEEAIVKKMHIITEEFRSGFELIVQHPKSVTFFGSARFEEGNESYEKARALAKKISEETGYAIVSGGGPGIMEAANRGAFEAGGKSIGYTIRLPHEQTNNPYMNDFRDFNYFFVRKLMLTYSAEAYIYCPGGFGTMDELFGILTLIQTRKIPSVPIILFGKEYWTDLINLIKYTFIEKYETASPEDLDNLIVTDDMDEVVEIIKHSPLRRE
jgi:uncharacterized protein (TIGR00730 family)